MTPDVHPPFPRTEFPRLLINAALTGGVITRERAPNLPVTTEQIVADAVRVHAAGAAVVHLHVRDHDGRPEWRKEVYAEVIAGIRESCPALIICASTTGRAGISLDQRTDVLSLDGNLKPDMASLALGSFNFRTGPSITSVDDVERLAATIRDAGVVPELEVFDLGMAAMAHRLQGLGLIPERPYANLVLGVLNTAPANMRSMLALSDALPAGAVWAAGAIGSYQPVVHALALAAGAHVRTGLEDNPDRHDGSGIPASNQWLVERVVANGELLGREPIGPAEARELLGV